MQGGSRVATTHAALDDAPYQTIISELCTPELRGGRAAGIGRTVGTFDRRITCQSAQPAGLSVSEGPAIGTPE
jgi:hypothetical protein